MSASAPSLIPEFIDDLITKHRLDCQGCGREKCLGKLSETRTGELQCCHCLAIHTIRIDVIVRLAPNPDPIMRAAIEAEFYGKLTGPQAPLPPVAPTEEPVPS